MGFLLVLLTILKIIGIIIASVIALLLIIVLTVLFTPIRYSGKAGYHGKPDISVKLTYLLKLFTARFEMHEGKREFIIRIFGCRLGKNKKKRKKQKSVKTKKSKKVKKPDSSVEHKSDVNDDYIEVHEDELPIVETVSNKKKDKKNKKNVSKKAKGIYNSLSSRLKNINEEINDESNRRAFKVVKDAIAGVLKHIKPQKHKVSVTFGTGNPATTGELLGGIYVFIYMSELNAEVYPDFEEKVFEADSEFKGRIRIFTLLRIGLKTYKNEDFKKALSRFM